MARPRTPAPFPSDEQILDFIRDTPGRPGKREIARAFHLDADQKRDLKKVLRRLETEGTLQRGRHRRFHEPGTLPPVTVVEVTGTDLDGEVLARPVTWDEEVEPPPIYMAPERRGQPALGRGDRVLARLTPLDPAEVGHAAYEGRTIRRIAGAPARVLGIFEDRDGRGWIRPVDKRAKYDFVAEVPPDIKVKPGHLVWAEVRRGSRLGARTARVLEVLGSATGPQAISMIAVHDHDIPTRFPDAALAEAEAAGPAALGARTDLRTLPLVTIDGADARDFDDAVWAEADPDPGNGGGWHLVVAIADVAWYVRPGAPLDRSAYERGNSVYFPDRVVPMLPEALSNGWCSLVPDEDRPCMAAHLWIDGEGHLRRHRFERAMMRSAARLTYEQVQAARDGAADEVTGPLAEAVIAPLYGAYAALERHRTARGVLELDLPERRVIIDDKGKVAGIEPRARLDSHKLIEEFMICANVAAAETLERLGEPCMYRIHDAPSKDKLESLRQFLETLNVKFARGQVVQPAQFNKVLDRFRDTPHTHMVSEVVLRSQSQAEYGPENIGHFGLALRRYCHFTSPIRRYSDLLVHRALIRGGRLGDGGLEKVHKDFAEMGQHLSMTERRAAAAERDAVDRFTAAFLADRVGARFAGRITGVTRFGLFVRLADSGGDGLVPIGSLGDDYFVHDEARHALVGRHSGAEYRLGDEVTVVLREAEPITGGLILELADGAPARRGGGRPRPAKGGRESPRKGGGKRARG
ncbi:MAG: ribonuclease R [Hyphomicrobiales bacterium]|nr:ribonuclease R [Hyphomicrobiales bacterium]MCP5370773.1 ribonuclease R [Hyphomicrobiales bacterium]